MTGSPTDPASTRPADRTTAPHQAAARWKPHRAGIRNIWEYDDQVFEFADGRMILRGPNGSGKSNALALIFPFLFDGTMSAAAMDPFAGGRSMKSLLLGVLRDDARAGFRHDQRLGYVWLEFIRSTIPSDGTGNHGGTGGRGGNEYEYRTVGCGARARADGDARSWFFFTDRRVGIDLDLAPDGTPLTRGKLAETLGADAVVDRAEDHRRVVARDLLGIDPEALGKLNGLIRALRRPQLAGKLNVDELSAVLSNGLPAVATATLDDIAASLDDLERVQHELAAVRDALATVDAFLPTYRTYLTGEARERAQGVVDHDRRLTTERRGLERLRNRHTELTTHDTALRDERSATETHQAETAAEREALKDSERFKGAQALQQEELRAVDLEQAAQAATERCDEAVAQAEQLATRADETERAAQQAETDADRALQDTMDRADRVRATWSLEQDAQQHPDHLAAAIAVMVRERRAAVTTMRAAIRTFETAVQTHRNAQAARSNADAAADAATQALTQATETRDGLRDELAGLVATWLADAPGVSDDDRQMLQGLIGRATDGEAVAFDDQFRLVTAAHRDALRDEHGSWLRAISDTGDERADVQTQRDAVAAEEDVGPPVPLWRTAERTGRPGAPLWACCDFADDAGLDPAERANLEVALDAAGLLDAWIAPDGTVGDGHDVWLHATDPADAPPGRAVDGGRDDRNTDTPATLADVLAVVVPDGSGLVPATISNVLAEIGLGSVGVAVDTHGHFTLGPLTGRATKAAPEFIGATSRAERRARRLADFDAELARLDAESTRLAAQRDRVADAIRSLQATADQAPDARPLVAAGAQVVTQRRRVTDAQDHAQIAATAEAEAAAAVEQARSDRETRATRLGVPATHDALDGFTTLVEAFGDAGRDAVQLRTRAGERAELAAQQRSDADAAHHAAKDRTDDATAADRDAKAQRRRADTLRKSLGDDVTAVFDEVAALGRRIDELTGTIRSLGADIEANQAALGEASASIDAAQARIDETQQVLADAQDRLGVLRRDEVLTLVGLPGTEMPLDPVRFATWLADHIDEPADDADHIAATRAMDRAQKQLIDDLHHGYAASIAHDDDLIFVEVTGEDRSVFGVAELRDRLDRQAAEMEQHLTDSDREIFERHLLNRVSHELRRLLGEADEFVAGVNEALARTATASGLRIELRWEAAGDDPDTAKALGLLRRDTAQMGDDDRAALRRFFDLAIRRQRAEDPDDGYRANLETVVDYRQWHRFQPFLVGPDGRARLTRNRFRGLSGGEQAVALHLPLFAAAAAHYDRADPGAPRLVALDEAFAGIDEAMRGDLLGLTVAFDLDVLLTGHELWGAYAQVPAIAVHDLLRRPPLEGVSVLSLRWDGHDLLDAPTTEAPGRPATPPDEGLFAPSPGQE